MTVPVPNYANQASFLAGHDGDSFWLRVDRGLLTHGIRDTAEWYVRLYGIDTWELTGPDAGKGKLAAAFTAMVLSGAKRIVVQTIHPDDRPAELEKYGRVLARVWADGEDLADVLRANGFEKAKA